MSGFAGIVGTGASLRELRRMARVLDARGPAGRWEAAVTGAAFSSVRSGELPLAPPVAQAEGWLVALDGPLAIGVALAREFGLGAEGGGAEVVARMLALTGPARTLARLPGDVGVAAFELQTGRAVVARARLGHRAIQIARTDGGLRFATDARALALSGSLSDLPDPGVAQRMLALGLVAPPASALAGLRALAAGAWIELEGGTFREWRGWVAPHSPARGEGNRERFVRSARYVLDLAATRAAAASGPYTLALSGGLASAALLAVGRGRAPEFAVTVDLDPAETARARERARALEVPWRSVPLGADEIEALLGDWDDDQPGIAPEALALRRVAEVAWKEGLSGLSAGVGASVAFDPPVPTARGWRRLLGAAPQAADSTVARFAARHGAPLPGDEATVPWAELEGWRAAHDDGDAELSLRALQAAVGLPEAELRVLDLACATWGLAALAPFADLGVIEVGAQIPANVHHAVGQRSVLAEVATASGLAVAAAPSARSEPPLAEWLRAFGGLDDLPERLEAWVAPAHLRELIRRFTEDDPRVQRRLWFAALLARWLGNRRAVGR